MLWPPEETAAFFLLCFAFTSMRRLMLDDDTCLARLLPGSTKRFAEEVVLKEPQIVVFFFVMVPQSSGSSGGAPREKPCQIPLNYCKDGVPQSPTITDTRVQTTSPFIASTFAIRSRYTSYKVKGMFGYVLLKFNSHHINVPSNA
jgi:hypothetical protein